MINKIKNWIEDKLSIKNKIYSKLNNNYEDRLIITLDKMTIAYIFITNKNIQILNFIENEVIYSSNLDDIICILNKLSKRKSINLNHCQVFEWNSTEKIRIYL